MNSASRVQIVDEAECVSLQGTLVGSFGVTFFSIHQISVFMQTWYLTTNHTKKQKQKQKKKKQQTNKKKKKTDIFSWSLLFFKTNIFDFGWASVSIATRNDVNNSMFSLAEQITHTHTLTGRHKYAQTFGGARIFCVRCCIINFPYIIS